jgi:hypothetical protein
LIKFAILNRFIPTTHFPSAESLRSAVYDAIGAYQDEIRLTGAYNGFWDISYEGRKRVSASPKKEIEIHPLLYSRLREFALMRSIEIVAENKTSVGNVDFSFIGFVENVGPVSICVEVKTAHAEDLIHGVEKQLPAYMAEKQSKYGAYIIFWFKGEWFDKPTTEQIKNMKQEMWGDENLVEDIDDLKNFKDIFLPWPSTKPLLQNIRVFIFDVTKPISAGKI